MDGAVRALVVEDNIGVRQLISAILARVCAQVLQASSAKEALELMESNNVDVLFADLRLPDNDGLDVIRSSLRLRPRIASVVLTGAATLESAIEAIRLGACDYVTKPVERQKILAAFERARAYSQLRGPVEAPGGQLREARPRREVHLVAASPQMRSVVALARKVARTDVPVLIQGETGVGKKLLARMIHFHSAGAEAPFVHVACEALRDAPFEAERTFAPAPASRSQLDQWDSLADKPGGGTLFLQDVGKLPLWAQIKLLCTLEDGWPSALAADESWTGKVRVIASTNGGLENDVAEGRFHRGLYDRLNLAPIKVPPLRERPQDIEALARHYLEQFSRSSRGKNGRACCDIPQDQWELLLRYRWPGNARELESVMARAILAGSGIGADSSVRDYLRTPSAPPDNGQTMAVPLAGDLKAIERHIIREMVRRCGGNKAAAARALGMHRRTLYRILEDGRMCAQARI